MLTNAEAMVEELLRRFKVPRVDIRLKFYLGRSMTPGRG